ncbi:uncharacterized [Tachysurus ichikawai]
MVACRDGIRPGGVEGVDGGGLEFGPLAHGRPPGHHLNGIYSLQECYAPLHSGCGWGGCGVFGGIESKTSVAGDKGSLAVSWCTESRRTTAVSPTYL